MINREPDNIFPLTKEEILEIFPFVFENNFQSRTIEDDFVWNIWIDKKSHDFFHTTYTKGYSTSAILIDKHGVKDYVEFWRYYRGGVCYGYSFKDRGMFKEILKN